MSVVTKLHSHDAVVPPHLQAPVLLPSGETELVYLSHQLGKQFGRGVLTIWFWAVDYGNVAVPRYYNVTIHSTKRFSVARRSALVSDFQNIFTRRIARLDHFPIHWLRDVQVLGELGVVKNDANRKSLPDNLRYSVVRELVKCL